MPVFTGQDLIRDGKTLAEVDKHFRQGTITEEAAIEYLRAWNACPGRLTFAELSDGRIRQRLLP